jgi:hypothetical protein
MLVLVCVVQSARFETVRAQEASTPTGSTPIVSDPLVLVPTGAVWKYLDDGSNQTVDWRAPGFDDASWAEGPAALGYGDGDEATVVDFGPDDQAKFPTTYFRHTFTVNDASALTNFLVRVVRDDGAIVYLNGVEIFRSNMAEGAVLYDDFAAEPVAGDDEVAFVSGYFTENHLAEGANVLAVELHQADGPSTDLGFELELRAGFEPGPPTVVITAPADGASVVEGSIAVTVDTQFEGGVVTGVEFFAGETKIGESFTAPFTFPWRQVVAGDYTVTAQAQTSLGLVGTSAPVAISVTSVSESMFIRRGDTWMYLADGADLGTAWRGAAFDALASDAADYAAEPLALNLNQLLPGTNVVAVEVHQGNVASSDLLFDLRLEGE